MKVVGRLRTAFAAVLLGYLAALATVVVPGLALLSLLGGGADRPAAIAALVASGPVCALVTSWRTTATVLLGVVTAGASVPAAPPAVVDAVAVACARTRVPVPLVLADPRRPAGPHDRPVVVRGIRRAVAVVPAHVADPAAVGAAVARELAGGGAATLTLAVAVCRWYRVWLDAARLCVAPLRALLRARRFLLGAATMQLLTAPFAVLALLAALPARLAAQVAVLIAGPSRCAALVAAFGTAGGRALARQEVDADPRLFERGWGIPGWLARDTLAPTTLRRTGAPAPAPGLDPGPGSAAPWALATRVAAGCAGVTGLALAACVVILAPAVGFAGAALADRHVWPGERAVTATVVGATTDPAEDGDEAVLVDLGEDRRVTVAAAGGGRAVYETAREVVVGDTVTLALPAGVDPTGPAALSQARWTERQTVLRQVTVAVLTLGLAWVVFALVLAQTLRAGGTRDLEREGRVAQAHGVLARSGDPAAAAALAARAAAREENGARWKAVVAWGFLGVIPVFFLASVGEWAGGLIGGAFDAGAGGRRIGFGAGVVVVWGAWMLLAVGYLRSTRRRGAAPARHGRAGSPPAGARPSRPHEDSPTG